MGSIPVYELKLIVYLDPTPLAITKERSGKKKIIEKHLYIKNKIQNILEENTAEDPINDIKWANKSVRNITNEINSPKSHVKTDTVASIVKELGFCLQLNKKSFEGGTSEERDNQFCYINSMIKNYSQKNISFISVDTKKKEFVGNFNG